VPKPNAQSPSMPGWRLCGLQLSNRFGKQMWPVTLSGKRRYREVHRAFSFRSTPRRSRLCGVGLHSFGPSGTNASVRPVRKIAPSFLSASTRMSMKACGFQLDRRRIHKSIWLKNLSMPDLPSPLIDVLSAESFADEHLPGSVNICVYETAFIDKIRASFPDAHTALTVYGLNDSTLEAGVALTKLGAAGYTRVQILPGGLEGWKAGGGKIEQSAAVELPSGRFEVDQTASLGEWMGRNLYNRHLGTVRLGPGYIEIRDGRLAGGHLTVDMTSLACTDIPDPGLSAHLIAHLKNADFFLVEQYPQAKFEISKVEYRADVRPDEPNYDVKGDFTLRGVTRPLAFAALVARKGDGSFTAQAPLDLDRTLWGAYYGSAKFFGRLGQHLVNDEFHLHLKVVTTARPME
jgi:polyisoprenoid-binding protein YceI/rhodanese-related sulfurtransferase